MYNYVLGGSGEKKRKKILATDVSSGLIFSKKRKKLVGFSPMLEISTFIRL